MTKPAYRRILLKLSGEALMGDGEATLDPAILQRLAGEVGELVEAGIQPALVVGGGNILRGAQLAEAGANRVRADHMGMLATVINSLALQNAIEQAGLKCRVMSALSISAVCEDYSQWRAIRHLQKGWVLIFAAGTGNPFFTTDSAASLRAIEIQADLLIKATKVNGVFAADPVKQPDAERFTELSYDEVLARRLAVMDTTAIVLCRDHRMPLRVLDMNSPGAILRATMGEAEGTLVH